MAAIRALVAAALPGLLASTACAAPPGIVYKGICEASAAAVLDAKHFIVADDERNALFVYEFGVAEPVAAPIDLTGYLDTEIGSDHLPKKSDLEAGARIGDRIYWMGSHSRDGKGKKESSRQRFFATPVTGHDHPWVTVPSRPPYRDLLKDIASASALDDISKAARRDQPPETIDGLNIEGLAATPDGELFIGFRSPVVDGRALVLRLNNPAEVVDGAKASFGKLVRLDLEGRGIRSIDRVEDGYLIVAGPWGTGAKAPADSFAVFAWSGDASDRPKKWTNATLAGLGPEALIPIPGTQSVLLLSDDGDLCRDAKVPPSKFSFRTRVLDRAGAVFR